MNKWLREMIKRFIVWYLKRHNVEFIYNGYAVRMFTEPYYYRVMRNHNLVERRIFDPFMQIKIDRKNEKGGGQG